MENTEQIVVRKTVRVQIPVERAFSIFVEKMETWWPATHHIAPHPFQSIVVEPRVGGKWFERDANGNECQWGQVLAWAPPRVVTLSWHLGPDWKFNPDLASASEVEIRFTEEAQNRTLVELAHSELQRHGEGYQQYAAALDGPGAWIAILTSYATTAEAAE